MEEGNHAIKIDNRIGELMESFENMEEDQGDHAIQNIVYDTGPR